MTVKIQILTIIVYFLSVLGAWRVFSKKEYFLIFHFFVLGYLEFDSRFLPIVYFSKFTLVTSLTCLLMRKDFLPTREEFRKLKLIILFVFLPYLLTSSLVPYIWPRLIGATSYFSIRELLVPMWALLAIYGFIKIRNFQVKKIFASFDWFSVFTILVSIPGGLVFFIKSGLYFHRIRDGRFHEIEDIKWVYLFLNEGEKIPKIWFLVDSLMASLFIISISVTLVNYFEKAWEGANTAFKRAAFVLSLFVLVMWNCLSVTTTIFLVIILIFGLTLFIAWKTKNFCQKRSFFVKDLILPFLFFLGVWYGSNMYNQSKWRFNSVEKKVALKKGNFKKVLGEDGKYWMVYELDDLQTRNNLTRVEKWYTQYINLKNVGLLKGIGYPRDEKEELLWKNELGLLSGHSKMFDDFMRLGLLSGVLYNYIFFFPALLLIMFARSFFRNNLEEGWLWLKWFALFMGVGISATINIWGEITLSIGLQLLMFSLFMLNLLSLNSSWNGKYEIQTK